MVSRKYFNGFFTKEQYIILASIDRLIQTRGIAYPTAISHYARMSINHVIKLVDEFESMGLVKSTYGGRTRYVEITEEGRRMVAMLSYISNKTGFHDVNKYLLFEN